MTSSRVPYRRTMSKLSLCYFASAVTAALTALPLSHAMAAAPALTLGQATDYSLASPGTETWQVQLRQGRDYALATWSRTDGQDCTATLTGGGKVVAQVPLVPILAEDAIGTTFRAPFTGTYFVTVRLASASALPATGSVDLGTDCCGNRNTQCRLPVG